MSRDNSRVMLLIVSLMIIGLSFTGVNSQKYVGKTDVKIEDFEKEKQKKDKDSISNEYEDLNKI